MRPARQQRTPAPRGGQSVFTNPHGRVMSRLPLQNRVDPSGQLHAVPSRGALMGNRGILHDGEGRIRRQWANKAWVTCLLSYSGIRRAVFSPGSYSELFFLDEVTALAAGHRPCSTCQRQRHLEFRQAWIAANMAGKENAFVPVTEIDRVLHAERAIPGGGKRSFDAPAAALPRGTMFEHEGRVYLVWTGGPLLWSFDGYSAADGTLPAGAVRVLTPPSLVRMFAAGFVPRVHPSAGPPPG